MCRIGAFTTHYGNLQHPQGIEFSNYFMHALTFPPYSCLLVLLFYFLNLLLYFSILFLVCIFVNKASCLRCITTSPQSLNLNRKNIKVCETMCKLSTITSHINKTYRWILY